MLLVSVVTGLRGTDVTAQDSTQQTCAPDVVHTLNHCTAFLVPIVVIPRTHSSVLKMIARIRIQYTFMLHQSLRLGQLARDELLS
jgi:hypothetical protein